jgi:flagellin-like hook-associated protein FlgL
MKKVFAKKEVTNEDLAQKIDNLLATVDILVVSTAKGFEGVDRRFDQVENRLDKVESRLSGVDNRLDRVEDHFDNMAEGLRRVGFLNSKLSSSI